MSEKATTPPEHGDSELHMLKEFIASGFKKVDHNFVVLKKEIDDINKQLDVINKKIEALGNSTSEGLEDVGVKIESLTEEIGKIGAVTKYDQEYKNLRQFN